ncbi:hypothetical protein KR222_006044, partial [Zaprionus bogoriensis]
IQKHLEADVKIIVQDQVFECQLPLLQTASKFFKSVEPGSEIVIRSDDVTQLGFAKAYDWCLHGDKVPERQHIVEMYLAARYLNIMQLLENLWYMFESAELFDEGHAFLLYLEALPFNARSLQLLLLSRVRRFFLSAVCTMEFMMLQPQHVCDMLDSSVVGVNSEMEILMIALRWLFFNWEQRRQHVVAIMRAVRFHLMPSWYLVSLKAKQSHALLQEIYEQPAVLELINAGLSFSVTRHFVEEASTLQHALNMQNKMDREWIIDERAAHHHLYKCPNWKFLDGEVFNEYLKRVVEAGPQFYESLKKREHDNFKPCCQAV